MTSDLDSRLRHAAEALRQAPGTPPAHPPRPGHFGRTGALVVAVLALVVGAVTFLRPSGDEGRGSLGGGDVAIQPELPRLMPDWVPEGFTLGGASGPYGGDALETMPPGSPDFPEDDDIFSSVLFGDPDAEDGFGRVDLSVTALRSEPSGAMRTDSFEQISEPVTVRGHVGRVCQQPGCEEAGPGAMLRWEEEPGFWIDVSSLTMDADQLLAVAEALTFPGDVPTLEDVSSDLPSPLVEMERFISGMSLPPEPRLWLTYADADGYMGGPALSVTTELGDESTVRSLLRPYEDRRPVVVRGHDGWIGTSEPEGDCSSGLGCSPGTTFVVWQEAPGIVISAEASGTDLAEADFFRFIESLRLVTDDEWAAAVAMLTPRPTEDIIADVMARIPGDAQTSVNTDGMGTAAYVAVDGQVCGVAADPAVPEVCGSPEERVHVLRDRNGGVIMLFGLMPEGAHDVIGTLPGRDPNDGAPAFLDRAPEDNPVLYAWTPMGYLPETLRFRDGVPGSEPVEVVPIDLD